MLIFSLFTWISLSEYKASGASCLWTKGIHPWCCGVWRCLGGWGAGGGQHVTAAIFTVSKQEAEGQITPTRVEKERMVH